MHINPIKSRPLSPEGRENYDRIFRKKITIDELVVTPEYLAAAEQTAKELGLDKPLSRERFEQARRAFDHRELTRKHIDESA